MKTEKAISIESLQRLWSAIALLRREVEQAERDQATSQVQLASAIEVAPAQLLLNRSSRPLL
jgi:hypothetical protein